MKLEHIGTVTSLLLLDRYQNIMICPDKDAKSFTVHIHMKLLQNYELYHYLQRIASTILKHYENSWMNGSSLFKQNYLSPNVFWHGRETNPNNMGPWFDDGFGGDHQHLWTVILSEYVINIDWCMKYATRPLFTNVFSYQKTIVSGWIVVFNTRSHQKNKVKIMEFYELENANGSIAVQYEETIDIIARIGYPIAISNNQATIARRNGFKGAEHPDSYIFTKNAQQRTNLAILRKYKLVWHKSDILHSKF
eukprot:245951_1